MICPKCESNNIHRTSPEKCVCRDCLHVFESHQVELKNPPIKFQKRKNKFKKNDLILLKTIGSLVLFTFLIYITQKDPYICSKREIKKVESFFDPLIDDWDATNALASSTPRIALSTPVSKLQDIQQEVVNSPIPKCAKPLGESFINMASKEIDSYLVFMSDESEDVQSIAIKEAETAQRIFISDYTDLQQGLSLDSLEKMKRLGKETERLIKDLEKK